jgi:hypothetical protein
MKSFHGHNLINVVASNSVNDATLFNFLNYVLTYLLRGII